MSGGIKNGSCHVVSDKAGEYIGFLLHVLSLQHLRLMEPREHALGFSRRPQCSPRYYCRALPELAIF